MGTDSPKMHIQKMLRDKIQLHPLWNYVIFHNNQSFLVYNLMFWSQFQLDNSISFKLFFPDSLCSHCQGLPNVVSMFNCISNTPNMYPNSIFWL